MKFAVLLNWHCSATIANVAVNKQKQSVNTVVINTKPKENVKLSTATAAKSTT